VAQALAAGALTKTAFGSQMTDQPLDPRGHDNLFEPVDEDRGAHGPFDDKAQSFSPQYELAKHRAIALAGLRAAAVGYIGRGVVGVGRDRGM
jgi:hypothetical protein